MRIALYSIFFCLFLSCNSSPFVEGKLLYESKCSSCHMSDGSGLKNIYPNLKENQRVWNGELNIPCLIRTGHVGNGISASMPGFTELSQTEVSNIVNYLRHSMNGKESLDFNAIKSLLDSCDLQH